MSPHLSQRVEAKHANVTGGALIAQQLLKIAAVRIGSHVIESAVAPYQLNLEHVVWTAVLSLGEAGTLWKQKGECSKDERLIARHGGTSRE